ncbi:MAG: hypothetical protein PHY09_02130, partial [Desulfuromonadaceae bacterium]|nr:hypothetical protein [Desulfuromonadaceae bacterium]MDD5105602.1 hypothetical protein [Desulfuromonadaceae bacterium]
MLMFRTYFIIASISLSLSCLETRDTPHISVANVKIVQYYLTHAKNSPHHSTRPPTSHHATWQ